MIYLKDIKIKKVVNDCTLREISIIKDNLIFNNSNELQEFETEIIKLWKKMFNLDEIIIEHGEIIFYGDELW